jgi:hypothetical protein
MTVEEFKNLFLTNKTVGTWGIIDLLKENKENRRLPDGFKIKVLGTYRSRPHLEGE